jgi:AcrR family transcriptional regulator
MLNMCSAPLSDDRTTRARIRDAAIACFADAGVAATSVRTIAAAAGVSPALVIHHFGSKDALRTACDEHVAASIREGKQAAMAAGTGLDPLAALRESADRGPIMRYLARTLADDTPAVGALVDEMVADAVGYMELGVETGTLRPSEDPYGRAALLTVWSLGALVLHEHLERLLGVDLTGDPAEIATATRYLRPATEIIGTGVLTEEMAARMLQALDAVTAASTEQQEEGS